MLWDDEAGVWYTSETPIQGVLAEAPTLEELAQKLSIIIPEILEMEEQDFAFSQENEWLFQAPKEAGTLIPRTFTIQSSRTYTVQA